MWEWPIWLVIGESIFGLNINLRMAKLASNIGIFFLLPFLLFLVSWEMLWCWLTWKQSLSHVLHCVGSLVLLFVKFSIKITWELFSNCSSFFLLFYSFRIHVPWFSFALVHSWTLDCEEVYPDKMKCYAFSSALYMFLFQMTWNLTVIVHFLLMLSVKSNYQH